MESIDGLVLRLKTYFHNSGNGTDRVANVSLSPAGRQYWAETFQNDRINPGIKTYIEKTRQDYGSPKSKKALRRALPYIEPVIRL